MRLQSAVLVATLLLGASACGDDTPTTPTTPVTLKFRTGVYDQISGTANDTVKGIIIIDDTLTLSLPYDSVINFPRGEHKFEARLNIDYLPSTFVQNVNPRGGTAIIDVPLSGSCRVYQSGGVLIDQPFCAPLGQPSRNELRWSERRRIYCPAGDFLEFCSSTPSRDGLGLTWPVDDANAAANEYVSQGKLLIAATVGPELTLPEGERKIATAMYRVGDYSPRRRLTVVPNDSSRYTSTVWTDVRHVPVYNFLAGQLAPDVRRNGLFGLEVKATYFLPQQFQDVLIVRYDVKNISNQPDYRRVHPQIGPNGFSVRDVYLTPTIDVDVGGAFGNEPDDDAATVFPAEGLVMAYDRNLAVSRWLPPWNTGPGLVGMTILDTDAGTPKGVVFSTDTLDYLTRARELEAHAVITAGRGTPLSGCADYAAAFICGGEAAQDVRIGYSVGPIASLAPGETRTLTVAILLAAPTAGQFTSGTALLPGNTSEAELASTTKASYRVAAALRALAAAIADVRVTAGPQ